MFSPLSMMLAVGLSYMAFIMLRYVFSTPTFWRIFFLVINGCWILSKTFYFASTEMIIWFLFFRFFYVVYYTHNDWFADIEKSLCPLDKTPFDHGMWSCIVGFALLIFFWGVLHLCSLVIFACNFLFCGIFVWFWYHGDSDFLEWIQKCSFLCIFWNSFRRIGVNSSLNVL